MKDLYEVIRQKEADIAQLKKEIDALRLVGRLLNLEKETEECAEPAARVAGEVLPRPAAGMLAQAPAAKSPVPVRPTDVRQFP